MQTNKLSYYNGRGLLHYQRILINDSLFFFNLFKHRSIRNQCISHLGGLDIFLTKLINSIYKIYDTH